MPLAISVRQVVPSASSYGVGVPEGVSFAAEYPAHTFPCQRFVAALSSSSASLGAGVGRYSFTV